VIYDATADRFIAAAVYQFAPDSAEATAFHAGGMITVAVSNDDTPLSGWHFMDRRVSDVPDFTSLASDGRSIYVTANDFNQAGAETGSSLFLLNDELHVDWGIISAFDPAALTGAVAGLDTLQPAKMQGASAPAGTFLVSYSGAHIGSHSEVTIVAVDNSGASPSFTR
jgi:hypothetical protein